MDELIFGYKTSKHYGEICEYLYPEESGLTNPIILHLSAEFEEAAFPIIQLKLSALGNEIDSDWVRILLSDPLVYSDDIEDHLKEQVEKFININKDFLFIYWEYIPNINASDLIEKI